MLTDGRRRAEIHPRHGLVDDRDARRAVAIAGVEIAARDQADADGVKKAGRNQIPPDEEVLVIGAYLAGYNDRTARAATGAEKLLLEALTEVTPGIAAARSSAS